MPLAALDAREVGALLRRARQVRPISMSVGETGALGRRARTVSRDNIRAHRDSRRLDSGENVVVS